MARLAHTLEPGPGGFLEGGVEPEVAMARLLDGADRRWPGLLDPDDRCRLGRPELVRAAALLRDADLLADDLAGLDAIFEFLVSRAARGEKGQFFTPRHVVKEVVRMMAPRAGERVADPACGSGAFLLHALLHAPGCEVYGFDQDPRAVKVARTLLAAAGRRGDAIRRLDSLQRGDGSGVDTVESVMRARGLPASFDVILANPPFAGDVGDTFRHQYALAALAPAERDVLFLERCVGLLAPGGRLAIVLPQNKVGGQRWEAVRRWLLEETRVVAVLGLGRDTFLPHTSQKASVVVAVRRPRVISPPPPSERVVFFVSDRCGKDGQGRLQFDPLQPGRVDHDLGEAVPAVQAGLRAAAGA